MRYWALKPDGKDAEGPFEMSALKARPGFGPDSIVAPENAQAADAWRPAKTYDDLRGLFIKPPPLPPIASRPSPAGLRPEKANPNSGRTGAAPTKTPPIAGWIIGTVVVIGGIIAVAVVSSPSTPVSNQTPSAATLAQQDAKVARIRKVEADRKAERDRVEQIAKKFRGTPIDYTAFYAKAKGTGLQLGKRYTFQATVTHDFCLYDTSGNHEHLLCADSQIEESNSERLEQFLTGPNRQILTVTAAMLEGSLGAKVMILRLE